MDGCIHSRLTKAKSETVGQAGPHLLEQKETEVS